MAKFFYDYEFIEHFVKVGTFKTRSVHSVEPIELGMIDEAGNELRVLYSDFDLKAAWQSDWLRKNVIKKYYDKDDAKALRLGFSVGNFNYDWFKRYIKANGVTRKEAVKRIREFVFGYYNNKYNDGMSFSDVAIEHGLKQEPIEFISWFSAYDHVCLCNTFGTMMDLPKGFPMFTIDIQQILEEKVKLRNTSIAAIEKRKDYPKQAENSLHLAVDDAKYHKELYNFVNKL